MQDTPQTDGCYIRPPDIPTIGTIAVISNGVQITSGGTIRDTYLIQILNNRIDWAGKTTTISFEVSELSGTFQFGQRSSSAPHNYSIDRNGYHKFTFIWGETLDPNKLYGLLITNTMATASMKLHSIKLELGPIATPFVPPDPTLELLKCQKCFFKTTYTLPFKLAYDQTNSSGNKFILLSDQFPVPMRTVPTMTIVSSDGNTKGAFSYWANGQTVANSAAHINTPRIGGFSSIVVDNVGAASEGSLCILTYEASADL